MVIINIIVVRRLSLQLAMLNSAVGLVRASGRDKGGPLT